MNATTAIPGYVFGSSPDRSPLDLADLEQLKASVLLGEDDVQHLRLAGEILADQVEDVLDVWYGFVGAHPQLLHYFTGSDGQPIPEYLAAVRQRFGQWILDTCLRPYDQAWLDYQHTIGLRHHRAQKNQTDKVDSVPVIGLRYLIALIYPITATMKPFLAKKGHPAEAVEQMHAAWTKSVVLQVALWSAPYVRPEDF